MKDYKELHIKQCKDIKFSHGGHLFACTNQSTISIFNFYSGTLLEQGEFDSHQGKVQSLSWFEDDSGFISSGLDGNIYVWELNSPDKPWYNYKEGGTGTNFTFVANSAKKRIYACGQDKTLREIAYDEAKDKDEEGQGLAHNLSV